MILPVTMIFAGVAAILNIWLAIRVGQVRGSEKVSIGDGGNEAVIRRMRAHSNYVEFTPFVLILIGVIELAHSGAPAPLWLWIVAAVYFLGRIGHGLGMDGGRLSKGRSIGTITTMLTLLGLLPASVDGVEIYFFYIPSLYPRNNLANQYYFFWKILLFD